MSPEQERQRALRGSVESRYLFKFSADLSERVKAAAKKEGISLAEWWRRAGESYLARSAYAEADRRYEEEATKKAREIVRKRSK